MKLEDQCVSLELAKRLKELGVKQESLFYWVHPINEWKLTIVATEEDKIYLNDCVLDIFPMEHYSSFTVAELLDKFPGAIKGSPFQFIKGFKLLEFVPTYCGKYEMLKLHYSCMETLPDKNPANGLAKMLIYLIENKLIEI